MITFTANTRRATAVSDDAITTRSVGIPVALDLSEHFDGLAVTLVCKAGDVSRDIAVLDPDALEVPVDCLQVAGVPLLLGLVGKNAAGTIVIRTTMALAGTIRVGTEESDVDPSDPTPSWAAQVQQYAQDAHDTAERLAEQVDGWEGEIDAAVDGAENVNATVSKSGSVATVTVTDRTGTRHTATVHDGATGPAGADGYSPTATVEQLADGATIFITDKDGTTTATIHDGADGATGPEGPAGYSPSARVTQTASGATITVTDQSGTTTADISNGDTGPIGPIGPTGEDGFSPTVDVQEITGGHEVTITDADGVHSFDVMDGDPAEPGSITDEMLAPDGIKPQVAQLFGNQLTANLSGTIDTASDAYAAPPMALTVEGASTQVTTTGKNLLDVNAYSVSGARLNANGDVVSTSGWYVSEYMDVSGMTSVARSGFSSDAGVRDAFYDSEKMLLQVVTHAPAAVAVPDGATYMRCSYSGNDRVGDAIQYESGTAPTTYEPYTERLATPRPDHPQPILSADNPKLQMRGNNLLLPSVSYDGTAILMVGGRCSVNDNVFSFVALSSDMYLGSLTAAGNQWNASLGALLPVSYGNEYLLEVSNADFKKNFVMWYDENLVARRSTTITSNTATLSVPSANIKWASLCIGNGTAVSGTTYETTIFFGTPTTSEPYVGTTVPLLPEGTKLRELPSGACDQLELSYLRPSERVGWAWYSRTLIPIVGSVDLGDLDWEPRPSQNKWYTAVPYSRSNVNVTNRRCDYYTVIASQATSSTPANNTIGPRSVDNMRTVYVRDDRFPPDSTSAADFKAGVTGIRYDYLMTVGGQTPITFDPIELPQLHAPNCTVWCDGGSAQPTFTMEYVRDTNLVIQAFEEALADLATS